MSLWCEIEPLRNRRKHDWVFALYHEMPTERDDGQWYEAFLFRNEARTVFGLKEQLGDNPSRHFRDYRAMATRVIKDKRFRNSLISDDPDLPRLWKKR
jgi:hypothetical protein